MTEPEDRIKALLVESLDAELGSRLEAGARSGHRDEHLSTPRRAREARRARMAPLAAAAAVAAVGVTLAVVVSGSSDSPSPVAGPGVPGVRVTCTADAGANPTADRAVLLRRANDLATPTNTRVTADVSGSSISIMVPGVKRSDVTDLCRSATVQLRPLVAPAVRTSSKADPAALTRLDFALPTSGRAYDQMTATQRSKLTHALSVSDCSLPKDTHGSVVVCGNSAVVTGSGTDGRIATLLGSPIVTGTRVTDARAQEPNAAAGAPVWTVALDLDKTGAAAWGAYTSAHNIGNAPESSGFASSMSCASATTPCADFVGFVVDGSLVSLPVNEAPINGGTTQISGNFDAATAKSLAAGLRAGQLPVPLSLTSVTITG